LESRDKDATTSMRWLWPRIEPVCCLQVRTWSPTLRWKESNFRSKIPVIIAPNFEIWAKHCVPCDVFLFYQKLQQNESHVSSGFWKNMSSSDFHPVSFLQVSFGHCRPFAASQVTPRKDIEVLYQFTQLFISFCCPKYLTFNAMSLCSLVSLF